MAIGTSYIVTTYNDSGVGDWICLAYGSQTITIDDITIYKEFIVVYDDTGYSSWGASIYPIDTILRHPAKKELTTYYWSGSTNVTKYRSNIAFTQVTGNTYTVKIEISASDSGRPALYAR